MLIAGVQITCEGFTPTDRELKNYVEYIKERVQNVNRVHVEMCDDGLVDVSYTAHNEPFERIRRVTGYLVGDLKRWNDAKQAEERDRVKHEPRI